MKLQKFLLILLSLMLVFTSTSFIALAEGDTTNDTQTTATDECMIVETQTKYATFADAFAALVNGQTIKLLKDVTLDETNVPLDSYGNRSISSKKVIIDGDNHTLTQSLYIVSYDVTIKNATYVTEAQFGVYGGTFTLDNVEWEHTKEYGVTLITDKASIIVIKNSTITSESDKTLIQAKSGSGMDITIENSTITSNSAADLITVTNAADITIKDSTITGDWSLKPSDGHGGVVYYSNSVNVNLTGNTVLNQTSPENATGTGLNAFFFAYTIGGNFEIDDTVTFNVNSVADQTTCSIFNGYYGSGAIATVVDHGATYNVSKAVSNAGFAIYSSALESDIVNTNAIALFANGALYNPNAKLPTDFTADVVSLKAYTTSHITNSEAVANAEAETIRFPVTVDAAFYEAVKDTNAVKFGIEIVAGDLITDTGVDWTGVEGKTVDQTSSEWKWAVEGKEYAALIGNFTEAQKSTKFAACGFVTVIYADASTAIFYADHTVELAKSLTASAA